jgi:hypothetical protein
VGVGRQVRSRRRVAKSGNPTDAIHVRRPKPPNGSLVTLETDLPIPVDTDIAQDWPGRFRHALQGCVSAMYGESTGPVEDSDHLVSSRAPSPTNNRCHAQGRGGLAYPRTYSKYPALQIRARLAGLDATPSM